MRPEKFGARLDFEGIVETAAQHFDFGNDDRAHLRIIELTQTLHNSPHHNRRNACAARCAFRASPTISNNDLAFS
jgi:hypothetical protein